MAAITDLSDLVNRATGGNSGTPETICFFRDGRVDAAAAVANIAGRHTSLWQYEGSPSGGAAPGAVAVPTNATAGAMKQTDAGGARTKWLTGFYAAANTTGTLILYDRLLHVGGFNGTTLTDQAVGGTLTRYTGAESAGNQIWVEIYTIIGTTARTITADYTDQGGNSGTTIATAIGGTGLREAQRIIPLPLADDDYGVRGVTDCILSASTGTAGNFGISIVRPLAYLPIPVVGVGVYLDILRQAPVEIKAGACLSLAILANAVTVPFVTGSLSFVEA